MTAQLREDKSSIFAPHPNCRQHWLGDIGVIVNTYIFLFFHIMQLPLHFAVFELVQQAQILLGTITRVAFETHCSIRY